MVAFTLTTIACVAALAHCSRRLIPQPEPSDLILASGSFVQAGARQAVKWRTLDDDPFTESLRLDKPLMVVIGTAYGRAGAQFDRSIFADLEIAERINLDFIPVRIDADLNPEWGHALLPLHDNANGIDPKFQIWFLSPEWVLLERYASGAQGYRFGFNEFVNLLGEARLRYVALRRSPDVATGLNDLQMEDLAAFDSRTAILPSVDEYAATKVDMLREAPGWPIRGGLELGAFDLELLIHLRAYDAAGEYIRRILESPTFDWQGMQPNIASEGPSLMRPELAQHSVSSASFIRSMAALGSAGSGPDAEVMRELAGVCLDYWLEAYMQMGDLLQYRYAPQSYIGRSETLSVPPAKLRARLDSAERVMAREFWNMGVEANPHVLPFPSDWRGALNPDNWAILDLIRNDAIEEAYIYGEDAPASTGFYATAKILEAALLLGDADRVVRAMRAYDRAKALRSGLDDVLRTDLRGVRPHRVLADYAAFSEAAYWAFLASGDVRELESGRAVLKRALELFLDRGQMDLSEVRASELAALRPGIGLPKAFDWLEPSSIGTVVNSCYLYGTLLRDEELIELGAALRDRYAGVYVGQQRGAGVYLRAVDRMETDSVIYVTGMGARGDADALRRLAPDRLVIPALGSIGEEFGEAFGDDRGVVVVRRGVATRFEFEDAVRMLGG